MQQAISVPTAAVRSLLLLSPGNAPAETMQQVTSVQTAEAKSPPTNGYAPADRQIRGTSAPTAEARKHN